MKAKRYYLPILVFIVTMLFSSCASDEVAESTDVNQAKIYQDYFVKYDAEDNEMNSRAVFRFGGSRGTTLLLSSPSKITVNGKQMKGEKEFLQGMVYRKNDFKEEVKDFEFLFTDTDKTKYKNSVTLEPMKLSYLPETISKTTVCTISWEGAPVGKNETVTLNIIDNNGTQISVNNKLKGSKTININPENMISLNPGTANIRIIREVEKNIKETTGEGGYINACYYSSIEVIEIVE